MAAVDEEAGQGHGQGAEEDMPVIPDDVAAAAAGAVGSQAAAITHIRAGKS